MTPYYSLSIIFEDPDSHFVFYVKETKMWEMFKEDELTNWVDNTDYRDEHDHIKEKLLSLLELCRNEKSTEDGIEVHLKKYGKSNYYMKPIHVVGHFIKQHFEIHMVW